MQANGTYSNGDIINAFLRQQTDLHVANNREFHSVPQKKTKMIYSLTVFHSREISSERQRHLVSITTAKGPLTRFTKRQTDAKSILKMLSLAEMTIVLQRFGQ